MRFSLLPPLLVFLFYTCSATGEGSSCHDDCLQQATSEAKQEVEGQRSNNMLMQVLYDKMKNQDKIIDMLLQRIQKLETTVDEQQAVITSYGTKISGLETKSTDQEEKLNDNANKIAVGASNIAINRQQMLGHEERLTKQERGLKDQGKLIVVQGASIANNTNEITRIDTKQHEHRTLLQRHNNQITDHERSNTINTNNIAGHETRILKQEKHLNAHRTQMASHKQSIASNANRIGVVERNIARHDQRFTEQERALTESRRQQRTYCNGQVAAAEQRLNKEGSEAYFTVVANGIQSHTKQGSTITFPVTRVNVVPPGSKGGWNSRTHEYVCPVSGDYLFIVSLFKEPDVADDYRCAAHLWQGGRILASVNNYQRGYGRFTSSMNAIAHCRAGDGVRVRTYFGNSCKLYGSDSHLSQFSGFLLKRRD